MGLFGAGKQYSPIISGAAAGAAGAGTTAGGAEGGLNTIGIPGLTSMIAKGGQLSPYMKANLAQERRGNLQESEAGKQTGLKSIAYRGLGGPSGATSSMMNVADRGRQTANTDALQRAYGSQAGLNLAATSGLGSIGTGFGNLQNADLNTQMQAQQMKDMAGWTQLQGMLQAAGSVASAAAGKPKK